MSYTQLITVEGADEKALHDHVAKWDSDQSGVAPGYQGARVFADGGNRHLIEVDFTSEEEARRNNTRPETAQWAEGLKRIAGGEPEYQNLRQVCTTYAD
jgi:hypothetical protein